MMREFGRGRQLGKPQVAYRETIRREAEARKAVTSSRRWPSTGITATSRFSLSRCSVGKRVRVRGLGSRAQNSERKDISSRPTGNQEVARGGILAVYPRSDLKWDRFNYAPTTTWISQAMAFRSRATMPSRRGKLASGAVGRS